MAFMINRNKKLVSIIKIVPVSVNAICHRAII